MSLVLPLKLWPAQDLAMWDALQMQGGPLDDQGALASLRVTTLKSLENRYGRWLSWLIANAPEAIAMPPAQRASMSRLEAWLKDLAHSRPMTQLTFVGGVLRVLRAYAPDSDWQAQLHLLKVLKHTAGRGDPGRKLGRILSSEVLLAAGIHLAARLEGTTRANVEAMIRQRDGTMIAMLALMPMRRRSFNGLRLGVSVHVAEDGIQVSLPGKLTKTGVPWEAFVPQQVEPLLRRYLGEVRPALMKRGTRHHDFLWVGRNGETLSDNYLGIRIGDLTLQLTGRRVPPHFFRDAAATTLARISPQSARLIRPVLAHSGFGTAERHYIHAQTVDAGRDYAALIRRLKRKTR